MKWFIYCLIVMYISISFLIGMIVGFTFNVMDEKIDQADREDLIKYYNIK